MDVGHKLMRTAPAAEFSRSDIHEPTDQVLASPELQPRRAQLNF